MNLAIFISPAERKAGNELDGEKLMANGKKSKLSPMQKLNSRNGKKPLGL